MAIREPQAGAWNFYPLNKRQLLNEIEKAYTDPKKGPGSLPKRGYIGERQIVGGIVPHAGYYFSAACAAWYYKELAEQVQNIDLAVILGTNHTGFGDKITTVSYYLKWATPLGTIDVDIDVIKSLKQLYPLMGDDALAHTREHSVEVQLPFLQYIYGDSFKLVPIVARDITLEEAQQFAAALKKAIELSNKKAVVIASSDFTHHGSIYDYVIFTTNVMENVRNLDYKFIESIVELDTKKFLSLVDRYSSTVCGYGAIAIAMEYAKKLNSRAKLLKYYHSGDVTGEEDIIVGYAAIEFYT
ncbi:MAG: AmmeMemoRadiSam system protein B [Ignisphaera sp.]|nr:AmmeMemoRadiSam system protein B [Ignisphaera sp.]MCX8167474.1 AmmeMemoRadiSam system protein B [Ignisphaera sp.]MDW8084662.1 AmmeMemoRadiSam system protein B [Ignisphaera sp.]